MKQVYIIGKNGYIASSFALWLKKEPEAYAVHTIPARGFVPETFDFSQADVVVFAAGIAHLSSKDAKDAPYTAVNCDMAVSTAQKAAQDGVGQFFYLSSMSVYGADSGAIDQHTPLSPKNEYGRSKQMAEEQLSQLRSPQFRVCMLRPPMVYGTNCRGNYQTLRRIACSVPVFPVVNNRRSMIHIDNLCAWMQWAIDTQSTDLLLPQDPFYVSTSEMVRLIAAAHGKKKVLIPGFGKLLSALPVSAAKKAFGSLYYAHSAEDHSVVRTLEEAISRTEGGAK